MKDFKTTKKNLNMFAFVVLLSDSPSPRAILPSYTSPNLCEN
jgi:hypothetical protein